METTAARDRYVAVQREFAAHILAGETTLRVPACPEWTVRHLLAHQVHQLQGFAAGDFPVEAAIAAIHGRTRAERAAARARQDSWIDAGVSSLLRLDVDELVHEWSSRIRTTDDGVLEVLLPDVTVHLLDLCGALGCLDHRQMSAVEDALAYWSEQAAARLQASGGGSFATAPSTADVVLEGSPYEVLRALTGRRTRHEVAKLQRKGAADALDDIAIYDFAPRTIGE